MRNNQFTSIPPQERSQFAIMSPLYEALKDSKLTTVQRHIILVLFYFIDGNGYCYPSLETISEYTGYSVKTIVAHNKILVKEKWIKYKRGNRYETNQYQLNLKKLRLDNRVVQLMPVKEERQQPVEKTSSMHLYDKRWYTYEQLKTVLKKRGELHKLNQIINKVKV